LVWLGLVAYWPVTHRVVNMILAEVLRISLLLLPHSYLFNRVCSPLNRCALYCPSYYIAKNQEHRRRIVYPLGEHVIVGLLISE